METEGKVAWVTGAKGFLGSQVARSLGARGWRVVGMARSAATCPAETQSPDTAWLGGGVCEASISQAFGCYGPPALVLHAAGAGTVRQVEEDPSGCFADTVQTTELLCEALRDSAPQASLILASSAAVYGDAGARRLEETSPAHPTSTYGRHKCLAEEACRRASDAHGLRTIAIRYFSLYGPGLRKQIVWDLFRRIHGGESRIELFGDGAETRDFLFIDDAVALALQAYGQAPGGHSVFNGGSGVGTTVARLAESIIAALGADAAVTFNGQRREGDPRHLVASPLKARSIGFQAETGLADGLARVARWVRSLDRV
ncbi:NAD-dependent epimerase/dehydratase family protein [Pelagibius sp. CAU 1746]|uniref:NAD-dependent epimerase/dehydratase family protein n=1 Tax=Pelagibius sp. CAU 1746 TaxID=3140370 RepID=UPI00325BB77F